MNVASVHLGPVRIALGRYATAERTVYLLTLGACEYVVALNRAGHR